MTNPMSMRIWYEFHENLDSKNIIYIKTLEDFE